MKVHKVSPHGLFLLLALLVGLLGSAAFAQEGFYQVSQGETRVQVTPLESTASAADFYGYTASVATTGLEKAGTATFFLYRNTSTGEVSLFALMSGPDGVAGTTTIDMSGIPAGASFLVRDDAFDFRDTWAITPPTANVFMGWQDGMSDGFAMGPLGEEADITLFPQFTGGISSVEFLYGSLANPSTLTLNLLDPIVISAALNSPPEASFTSTTAEIRVDEPVTFDASASYDADGTISSYEWDFDGDGIYDLTTTDPVVSYTYTVGGMKSVGLRASDADGASDRDTYTLFVAELEVNVERTISTMTALPGSTFLVVVTIEPEIDLVGVGLEEHLPVGWTVTPVQNAGAAFKRSEIQWVFIEKISAGTTKVISYEVTVPTSNQLIATTLPVCFDITGTFQSKSPALEMEVEGDNTIEINDTLRIETAIAHLVPGGSVDQDDSIDLRLSQKIEAQQLARALDIWRFAEIVPWTQGATIDLETMKRLAAYAYTCTPVDLPLPLVPLAEINALRTISTPVPCNNVLVGYYGRDGLPAGNIFTVKVEIWADQDLYGVGLEEDLPPGWRVIPVDNGGFTYKASAVEWVYPGKLSAGECVIIIYQVEVPMTAAIETPSSDPCFLSSNDLYGEVDSALPCQRVRVIGDSAVDISDCLAVLVAISRWDVVTDSVNISLSDLITYQQMQRAIAFWLEDEEVPLTCGGMVDYETLKTIVAYWFTNTDICEPLPSTVADVCDITPEPCEPNPPACTDF